MSMDRLERQQALQELVASEGWRLFLRYVEENWGSAAVLARMRREIAAGASGADVSAKYLNAEELLRQVVQWPNRELERQEAAQEKRGAEEKTPKRPTASRRRMR